MRYREIKPSLPLRTFIECFWALEGDGVAAGCDSAGRLQTKKPPNKFGPRLLARIVRFQQVFRAVYDSNPAFVEWRLSAVITTSLT